MATFVELQDEILKIVGRPNLGSGDQFRGRVKDYINRAYLALSNGLDFPELQKTSTAITTVSGTQDYALPVDTQFLYSITDTTNGPKLIKQGQGPLDAMGAGPGKPLYYARFINEIHLSPVPDGAFVIRVRYYQRPTLLSNDADVPVMGVEWDEAILMLANAWVAIATNRMDAAQQWLAQFQVFINLMRITGHSLTLGADEGVEIIGAKDELLKIGAPGTVPALGVSGPTVGP